MQHLDGAISSPLTFACAAKSGTIQLQVTPNNLILAGWTGRDHTAIEAHIEELGRLGVGRPRSVPIFYRVGASLITRAHTIQVYGCNSTGEGEFVLFAAEGRRWITVGSDQTDRKAEAIGVTLSKQLCAKPIGTEAWALDEIEGHWDDLVLRSFAEIDGKRQLYQDSSVRSMTEPQKLLDLYNQRNPGRWNEGWVMFCGTLPVHGEIRWADAFTVELEDPVLHRVLTHSYRIEALPDEG
jgi:hypothetical protein